jgi:HK97 family phage major capsid protein
MEQEFRRYFNLEIDEIRQRDRTIVATASTETPVDRGGFYEILSHANGAIDFSRFPLPLVDNHKSADMPAFGRATNPRVMGRKLKVDLVFGQSALAKERWQDVKDGIARHLSVGYIVKKKSQINDDMTYTVERWEPLELSIVPTPADVNAIIGRSKQNDRTQEFKNYFSARQGDKKMTRKEIKTKNDRELQEKIDRNNRYWLKDREFKDISEFLRAVKALDEVSYVDPRFRQSGLNEAVDGEMVGTDFSLKMISRPNAPEQWDRATKILLSKNTNSVKLPVFAEESRQSDSILGGFKFYYIAEADEKTSSKFKLRALFEELKKTACLIYGTDELWSDSQLGNVVIPAAVQIPWNAMIIEDITTGSGAGRPLGILNADCTITVEKESGQNAGTVVEENIKNILTHLPSESWQSPGLCWQVHKDMVPQLSTLTTAVGTGGGHAPMWHWREGGEKFNKLCGIDVLVNPYCPSVNERGTIILSDMREYIIAHKETKETTSMHFRFIYGEQAFRMVFRWDGQPSWSKAISPATGSNKISPFIVLGERS